MKNRMQEIRDSTNSRRTSNQFGFQKSDGYELLFRLNLPKEGESDWILQYFMQSKLDPSLVCPLAEAQKSLNPILKKCTEQRLSKLAKISGITAAEITEGPRSLTPEQTYLFLKNDAFKLRERGFAVQIPKNLDIKSRSQLRINMKLKKNLTDSKAQGTKVLEFDYTVSIGEIELNPDEFASMTKSKEHLVRVKNKWVEINPEDVVKMMELITKIRLLKTPDEAIKLSVNAASEGIETEFFADEKVSASIIDTVYEKDTYQSFDELEGFSGKLRPYQQRGLGWLGFLGRLGFGALLADDMGLGKTIQIIAYCTRLIKNGIVPILIICPTSVIGNWMDEFQHFAPGIRVMVHHGSERNDGHDFEREAKKADIIITSYALSWRDEREFDSVKWGMVVLDEAQNIKNPFAKQTQQVKKLNAKIRVALSGTPIENRLADLWSIMEFLNPGYLYSWEKFREKFVKPIELDYDEDKKSALRGAISPFIMRRIKTDKTIIADLPEKNEIIEWCRLTPEQATLYAATLNATFEKINSEEEEKGKMQIIATITKLKQICNHPANMLKDSNQLGERSGKVERLREILATIIENGESCLIFSQYTEMANLLYRNLKKEIGNKAKLTYLHGSLGRTKRDKIVNEFQNNKDRPRILILSLKAGGTGLNLTNASNVIHFDHWWNPAVENQATDRAHRIGQEKNVFVYKLITKGTIEEQIEEMLKRKTHLADSIVGTGETILAGLDGSKLKELARLRNE